MKLYLLFWLSWSRKRRSRKELTERRRVEEESCVTEEEYALLESVILHWDKRQMVLKWRQHSWCMYVCVCVCVCVYIYAWVCVCVTLPWPQTGFCQSGNMVGDTQQLTEGHDTGVCLGRWQECSDPQRNASRMVATLIRPLLCLCMHVRVWAYMLGGKLGTAVLLQFSISTG